MSRRRPAWAGADLPLALLVVGILVLAFVLAGRLQSDDPESPSAVAGGTGSPSGSPSGDAGQRVVPAPTVGPRAGSGDGGSTRGGRSGTRRSTCLGLPAPRISVATYNIHSALNRPRTGSVLGQVARQVRALDADVVILQEVDRNRRWSGHVDQAAYLGDLLGMQHAFATNVRRSGNRDYGTAILSRYEIEDAHNTLLPNRAGLQQRGLLRVRISPSGIPISIYDTHLENTSAEMRVTQAHTIARIVADDPLPAILGGDLNAGPRSAVLGALRGALDDTWPAAGTGAGATHPSGSPRARIDYLLHAGGIRPVVAQVVPGTASDHLAVRAVYELPTAVSQICLPGLG